MIEEILDPKELRRAIDSDDKLDPRIKKWLKEITRTLEAYIDYLNEEIKDQINLLEIEIRREIRDHRHLPTGEVTTLFKVYRE